jgi:putative transposase
MVVQEHPMLSVRSQCRLLRLSRSSYYCQPKGESAENLAIMKKIDEVYLSHPYYGSRRMTHVLTQEGVQVSRHRVRRLMRLMGIQAIHPKPRTSINNPEHKVYPYLLRNLPIKQPNQVWCSDITYVPMKQGFMYLTAIMDWYSRKVLSWRLSNTLDTSFCVESLEEALHTYGKPKIFNTDQGAQYTSDDFINVLKKQKIKISMDGKGRWVDSVFVERLWRSVKYDEVYLKAYDGMQSAKSSLSAYFTFYNSERRHQSLDRQTPDQVYYENVARMAA